MGFDGCDAACAEDRIRGGTATRLGPGTGDDELYDTYQANTLEVIGRAIIADVLDNSIRRFTAYTLSENSADVISRR